LTYALQIVLCAAAAGAALEGGINAMRVSIWTDNDNPLSGPSVQQNGESVSKALESRFGSGAVVKQVATQMVLALLPPFGANL
jgi:hypothetical protein